MIKKIISKAKLYLLENRSARQTITKNVFWLSVSQIGSRLIRAAIIIYAARRLGAAQYGIFSYALGLAGFFTIFSDLGVSAILTREASQKPDKESQYFATTFWIKIFLLAGTALLVLFLAPHFSKIKEANALIPFIALLVISDGLREFCLSLFRAREKMEIEAFVTILTNLAITVFGFIAIYISATSQALTFSYAMSTAVGAAAALFILRHYLKKVLTDFNRFLAKQVFNSAWPLTLSAIIGAFMLNTDIIMIGWWRTPQEIGYYSASQRILQVLYTLPAILASAVFPTLSRMVGEKNNEKVKNLMEKTIVLVFIIAIPTIIGGMVIGKSLITFLYGNEYLPAADSFRILLLTLIFLFPGILIGNMILAYDKQRKVSIYLGLAAIANIVFNAILIPIMGIKGAAIATVVAQSINTILTWRLVKKINNFNTLKNIKNIIVAAIIMGIFSFSLDRFSINIILNITFSAGIYFGVLILLKEKLLKEGLSILRAAGDN